MGADRCRGRAGLETVRSILTRWDRHCPNPACGRFCRRMFRCWRRSSLPRIEELTGDDYSEAQQEAWAAAAEDEEAFGKKLAGQLTLIATIQSAPVGFASLKGADHIDMLYVHPSAGRAGGGVDAGRGAGKTGGRARRQASRRSTPATPRSRSSRSAAISPCSATPSPSMANGSPTPRCRRRWPIAPRRERRHEPRTPLSLRHHAARRRADQRRRFHAA